MYIYIYSIDKCYIYVFITFIYTLSIYICPTIRNGSPTSVCNWYRPYIKIYVRGWYMYTEKNIFPFLFSSNGIWSWWQISFRFWIKWNFIWFKIERKTVTTIISHSLWKEMEIYFSQCTPEESKSIFKPFKHACLCALHTLSSISTSNAPYAPSNAYM